MPPVRSNSDERVYTNEYFDDPFACIDRPVSIMPPITPKRPLTLTRLHGRKRRSSTVTRKRQGVADMTQLGNLNAILAQVALEEAMKEDENNIQPKVERTPAQKRRATLNARSGLLRDMNRLPCSSPRPENSRTRDFDHGLGEVREEDATHSNIPNSSTVVHTSVVHGNTTQTSTKPVPNKPTGRVQSSRISFSRFMAAFSDR